MELEYEDMFRCIFPKDTNWKFEGQDGKFFYRLSSIPAEIPNSRRFIEYSIKTNKYASIIVTNEAISDAAIDLTEYLWKELRRINLRELGIINNLRELGII